MDAPPVEMGWGRAPIEWQPPSNLRFAGFAWRAVALLVDILLLGLYWAVLIFGPAGQALNGPILAALLLAGPLLYFFVAWGRFGTTIGMRLLGLRIVRATDGGKIDYRVAVGRLVVFVFELVATVLIGGFLLILPILLDRRRRAVHDRLAGTVVIRPAFRGRTSALA